MCELVCSIVSELPVWPTGGLTAEDRKQDTIISLLKAVRNQSIAKLKEIRSPHSYWRTAAIRELSKTSNYPLGDTRNPLGFGKDGGVDKRTPGSLPRNLHQNRHDLVKFINGEEKTYFHDPCWTRHKGVVDMALSHFQKLPVSTQPILVSLLQIAQLDVKLTKREIDLELALEFNISPAKATSLRLKAQRQMEQLLGFKQVNFNPEE